MSAGAILDLAGVLRTFGGIRAVDELTFHVPAGETLGIIGPNGAGKSVLLNVINGVYGIEAGTISMDDERIDGLRPHQIADRGVGRAFQSTDQFREFRAIDYVMLGRMKYQQRSIFATALGLPGVRRSERAERELARRTLDRFGLAKMAFEKISELPYGVQKLVDIARVVAGEPRLMLLDEPTSGTTSIERKVISAVLEEVALSQVTMVIIDHDVSFISAISERVLVMNYGKILAEGSPAEVLARPDVIEAYLGI
jgi:branched-chain amino acid transport system ATP-binding protein